MKLGKGVRYITDSEREYINNYYKNINSEWRIEDSEIVIVGPDIIELCYSLDYSIEGMELDEVIEGVEELYYTWYQERTGLYFIIVGEEDCE